jgi:hypothetical protein
VRNPYARFYSFYKSKILAGQDPGNYYERFGLAKGCSFEECVGIITSLDPRELEHHAAPQSMLLTEDGNLLVDFVGKVESFAEDWTVINNLVGSDLYLDHLNRTDNFSGPVYSAETKERIFAYYRDDFLVFGYAEDAVQLTGEPGASPAGAWSAHHHLPSETIENLRQEICSSNEKIRRLSAEFGQDQAKREEFFGHQAELFSELLLKATAAVEKKADENSRAHLSLQKSVTIVSGKIDGILKFNDLCTRKFSEIKEEMNRRLTREKAEIREKLNREREEFQRQLNREREEGGRTRNLLYQHVLATFRQARRSRWKRLCRLLRSPRLREARFLRASGLVDPHYYFANYPQAMKPGMTAAEHYVHLGAQDGCNPSAKFNTRQYLAEHPAVAHDGINPLVHYILHGQRR